MREFVPAIRTALADYLGVPPSHLGSVEFTTHRTDAAMKSLEGAQFSIDFEHAAAFEAMTADQRHPDPWMLVEVCRVCDSPRYRPHALDCPHFDPDACSAEGHEEVGYCENCGAAAANSDDEMDRILGRS